MLKIKFKKIPAELRAQQGKRRENNGVCKLP